MGWVLAPATALDGRNRSNANTFVTPRFRASITEGATFART
jgi:hypothetical protein